MNKEVNQEFNQEQQKVLESIRMSRIILPVLLGIGVVIYLFWRQFDPEDFDVLRNWTSTMTLWVVLAVVLLVIRHLAYALRLRTLSDKQFSWKKCIELIFIWEFSTAVSPTSVGGSAVSLFVLSQEKLSGAKTATIIIYAIILDTIFFISTLPILYLIFGPSIIRPGLETLSDFDSWGYSFALAYLIMFAYGSLFFYGLFINPRSTKRLIVWVTSWKWLRRFQEGARQLGDEFILASEEVKKKNWGYHLTAFFSTATAWSCRFFLLNCLIIAFVPETNLGFMGQMALYSRLETMFVIMAVVPTPGGAGLAELAFWSFTNDYISTEGIALLVASLWRLLTFYMYLFVGAIVIPNWIRKLVNRRRTHREETVKK